MSKFQIRLSEIINLINIGKFKSAKTKCELLKNKVTILEINLNATGSFPIARHTSHDHSSHGASHSGGQHNHGSDKEEHDEDIIGKLIVNPK